jgi:hypothetical protein
MVWLRQHVLDARYHHLVPHSRERPCRSYRRRKIHRHLQARYTHRQLQLVVVRDHKVLWLSADDLGYHRACAPDGM